MECEACQQKEGMPRDNNQWLCDSCDEGIDTLYCSSCDEIVHENSIEWLNDCPLCECGAKLEL